MRPLVVSLLPRPPHATREGAAIRNYHLLSALSAEFRVRALSLMPPGADDLPWDFPSDVVGSLFPVSSGVRNRVRSYGRTLAGEPYTVAKARSSQFEVELARIVRLERPAWVIAHGYHVGGTAVRSAAPAWVDLHNIESAIWSRMSRTSASLVVRLATAWQYPLVSRHETSMLRHAQGYSVVSSADARSAALITPHKDPLVVPNGVDTCHYQYREVPTGGVLAFVGDLRWRPNAEGVAWFRQSVWPLLRERDPDLRVEILGRGANAHLLRMADDRFVFLGDEPDTRPLWRRAAIGIVPLRAGGGTRLKILEAAAMGVPVVSTSVGAEGLDLTPDREIIIRDDPRAWVESIAGFLVDVPRRREVAMRARARIEAQYDWRRIGQDFATQLAERADERRA